MVDLEQTWIIILIGIGMIALTMVLNIAGVVVWLNFLGRQLAQRAAQNLSPHLFRAILTTTIILLMLHLLEIAMWAVLYILLPDQSAIGSMHDAFYFSIVTFTTLGYGDITLDGKWQLLSGLESAIGIIMFGMTTALLYAVVQKCWKVHYKNTFNLDHDD